MKKLVWILVPSFLMALPPEGKVVHGSATFTKTEETLVINVASEKAIIHYPSFNIAEKETVQFVQPNKPNAAVLNRVTGRDPSQIFGHLKSNGKIFLINPNGIIFGPKSEVNVGSLIASTLDIENTDFLSGKHKFSLKSDAKGSQIINKGILSASPEGMIALIAPHIRNEGVINAQIGRVALLAGEQAVIDFAGDGLIAFAVGGNLESAIIEHLGKISAPQGEVFMHLKAADAAIKSVINIDGLIEGNTVVKENGVVRIANKSVIEAARISVSAVNVEVLGDIAAKDKLAIFAEETVRWRGSKQPGSLSLTGRVIAVSSPIEAWTVQMAAKDLYLLGADIIAHFGPVVFNAPASLAAQDVHIAADKIVFEGKLEADLRFAEPVLALSAGSGDIVFKAPVGEASRFGVIAIEDAGNVQIKKPVRAAGFVQQKGTGATTFDAILDIEGSVGLNLSSNLINLNRDIVVKGGDIQLTPGRAKIGENVKIQTAGSFLHHGEGELICGGSIQAGRAMEFKGPILLLDMVSLCAKDGLGEIIFHSNIEGPGSLSVIGGNLDFKGDIGRLSPLSSLSVNSSGSIQLANIGSSKPGIVQETDLIAKDSIIFKGTVVHSNSQNYTAGKEFRMASGRQTSFISSYANTPIIFKKSPVVLEEGSSLLISTKSGDVLIDRISAEKLQSLSIEAIDGEVMLGVLDGEIDNFSVAGGKISLMSPISARQITLSPKKEAHIQNNMSTTLGHMIFNGPVFLDKPNLTFTAAESGDIIFKSSLVGTGKLELHAKEGVIRLDGPVGGDNKFKFASFVASGKVVDQNGPVKVTGPLTYTGEIHLAGNINTSNNSIYFNGPVIRDGVDAVKLSTGFGQGDVIFDSTLDADRPDRTLFLTSSGKTMFKGGIGTKGALGGLTVNSKSISFQAIGGEKPGVEGHLHATAKEGINFLGKIFHAKEQTWIAKEYNFLSGQSTSVISGGQHLSFEQGTINLKEGTHFNVNSSGGELKIVSLSAPSLENVVLDSGQGEVHIGTILDNVGQLKVAGREIYLESEVRAKTIRLESGQNIYRRYELAKLSSEGDVFLNARQGSVGLPDAPVWVKASGTITVGARHLAVIEGNSSDGILHMHASNTPEQVFFNGIEYIIFSLEDLFMGDEGIISITPDLYTGIQPNSISLGVVRPRKAPLYYQP